MGRLFTHTNKHNTRRIQKARMEWLCFLGFFGPIEKLIISFFEFSFLFFSTSLSPNLISKNSSSSSAGLDGVVVHEPDDVPQLRDPCEQRLRGGVELGRLGPDGAVRALLERRDFLLEEGDLLQDLLGLPLAQLGLDDLLVLGHDLNNVLVLVLVGWLVGGLKRRESGEKKKGWRRIPPIKN